MPASLVSQIKSVCKEIHELVARRTDDGPNRLNYMRQELDARNKLVELRQQIVQREVVARDALAIALQKAEYEGVKL